jgi:cyclopropane fatty-acyl-phospholipid synthase-like methyltransferase
MPDRAHYGDFPARNWLARMVRDMAPGAHILDLGCGGGEPIARFIIDHGFRVTGIDLATSAILVAETRFPRERWIRADMRTVALDGGFDGVIAWNALTWLSHADQALMATRAADWLAPGGVLLFNAQADADRTLDDYREGSPYRADLEAANYSAQIESRGLTLIAHTAADTKCDGAGVWLARKPGAVKSAPPAG